MCSLEERERGGWWPARVAFGGKEPNKMGKPNSTSHGMCRRHRAANGKLPKIKPKSRNTGVELEEAPQPGAVPEQVVRWCVAGGGWWCVAGGGWWWMVV